MAQKRIKFERKSLREWIELEEARSKIQEGFKDKNANMAAKAIFTYLHKAAKNEITGLEEMDSASVLGLYLDAYALNIPRKNFPILKQQIENKEKMPWEYEERAWYFWVNLLSANYGWTMEYIAKLDIDDAIGLYQETEIDKQFNREWQWGLTELAYPYDETTKKSKFHPLTRPQWMMPIVPKPKIIKMRKNMIPIGKIEGQDELDKVFGPGKSP